LLADRESRRSDLLDAAFLKVTGVGRQQELPDAGVIEVQRG